jgi:YD repeat-containing protein
LRAFSGWFTDLRCLALRFSAGRLRLSSDFAVDQPNNRIDFKLRLNPAEFGGRSWNFSTSSSLGSFEIRDYSQVSVADLVQNVYDEARTGEYNIGQRTQLSNSHNATYWAYDARGRVISQTKQIAGIGPLTARLSYDSANRVTATTLPNGEVVRAATNWAS